MFSVRYIHAADLHLDASFRGLERSTQTKFLAEELRVATFTALERLVALCEKERPDFLVLAGDIYNEEDQSLKAQLHVRDACKYLNSIGIKVFITHGNHDPLSSRLQMLTWPEDTIIFSDIVQSHVVKREGQDIAVVHGISHASTREPRNLAKSFSRLEAQGHTQIFQLGVLHCTLENVAKADRYAPCGLDDLSASKLDAWALGHVHEGKVINHEPFVAYSGNTQGLHINETGPRGCLLVTVNPSAGHKKFEIESKFCALSPVVWESIEVNINEVEHIDEVEQAIVLAVEQLMAQAESNCTTLIARVCLVGRLELDSMLRKQDVLIDLLERVRGHLPKSLWLKDIVVETSGLVSLDVLSKRDDLLGETLRLSEDINNNDEMLHNFVQTSLAPLYTHHKAKHILQIPSEGESHKLMEEAQRLCADMMEGR